MIRDLTKFIPPKYQSTHSMTFDGIQEWMVNYNIFGADTFKIGQLQKRSVSIWVKSTKASGVNEQVIINRWFPFQSLPAINSGGWKWFIWDNPGTGGAPPVARALNFRTCTYLLNGLWIYSANPFPLNVWVHVVMTYNGSGNASGLKMYWDGVPQATHITFDNWFSTAINSNAYSHLLWGTQYNSIPGWPPVLDYFFEGSMDESCFWRHELTFQEVMGIFNSGRPINPMHVGLPSKPCDRYFRMGEVTDGTPWVFPGSKIAWGRWPVGAPGSGQNGFWNNDFTVPPSRVVQDVAP
jgi:hypothetical protein